MSKKFDLSHSTLIMGAGAHKPYNFPTSFDINNTIKSLLTAGRIIILESFDLSTKSPLTRLKIDICSEIKKEKIVPTDGVGVGSNSYDIKIGQMLDDFVKAFAASSATSIDSYLSQLPKSNDKTKKNIFPKIGKFILAYLISEEEKKEPLGCQPADWIQFIIKEYIEPDPSSFFKHPPKLITFNYDRLFERYVYEHLVEFHHMRPSEAEALVRGLNVNHVYGDLADFTSWHEKSDSFYSDAALRMKVIGEERDLRDLNETKQKIQTWIKECDKIYFLGYGFDPLNNDILLSSLPENWRDEKVIVSTIIGIGKRDLLRIREQIGFLPKFITKDEKIDCLDILKNRLPLEKEIQKSHYNQLEKPTSEFWKGYRF